MNSYIIKKIQINNNGKNIFGLLYMPLVDIPIPLVIYNHELANTHERGIGYAKYLASHGIATYIFDYCGGSNYSKSDGITTEMSILTEKQDLVCVVNYFRKLDDIDKANIFLIGASLGGLVASLYANEYPEYIQSLVLLYPGFNVYDILHKTYQSLEDVPSTFSFRGWMDVGKVFVKDAWNINPYDYMHNYNKHVLILHGDQDKLVDASYSHKAIECYPNAQLQIIKGANHHIFFKEYELTAQYLIYNFIKENIS